MLLSATKGTHIHQLLDFAASRLERQARRR
jgi:hypothetical protein